MNLLDVYGDYSYWQGRTEKIKRGRKKNSFCQILYMFQRYANDHPPSTVRLLWRMPGVIELYYTLGLCMLGTREPMSEHCSYLKNPFLSTNLTSRTICQEPVSEQCSYLKNPFLTTVLTSRTRVWALFYLKNAFWALFYPQEPVSEHCPNLKKPELSAATKLLIIFMGIEHIKTCPILQGDP